MGSTVQPPINEKSIATWRFFTRVPSHKFHFFIIIKVFIGILGESF